MDEAGYALMLGKVQGSLEGLEANLDKVLENQETTRRELIENGDRLLRKLEEHAQADQKDFSMIREGIGAHRDRIAVLEKMADTVESHGDAIVTMERRLAEADESKRLLEQARKINRDWQKGLLAAGAAASGAVGSTAGPKLLKWILSLFH